ncbi:hypothetical protein CHS0354_035443 [Potamilus streckersoni]|uniref:Uncharacterized protein n=1 Tax=Potamilus streckersoni TaxID=2493646 RepID=A0AAE0WAT5_9BIVA|nr:hypothetical protein CHS0354_035443 [Potamilus streckersoni]
MLYESGEFESTAEQSRLLNLLCFLCWNAGAKDKAQEHSRKCIQLEKENIVALCNRVWMTRKDGHLTEADKELNHVEEIAKSRSDLLLRGKAEIAYSYSVFGPHYFLKSMELYEELLENIIDKCIEFNLVQLWKMDLGIIYRKFCNAGNTISTKEWEQKNKDNCMRKAASMLYEVASSKSPARWRGRCYATLGEFSYSTFTGTGLTKGKEELFPAAIKYKNTESLLNLALQLCDDDSEILNICGKNFKYLKKLDKAENVLRQSLEKRETSYAHYHLALVLKSKLYARYLEARSYRPGKKVSEKSRDGDVSHEQLKSGEHVQFNERSQHHPITKYERARQNRKFHFSSNSRRNVGKNYSGEVDASFGRSQHSGRSNRGRSIGKADPTSIRKETNFSHELSIIKARTAVLLNAKSELMATGNDECEQYVSEHVCLPVNEQHPDPYRSQQDGWMALPMLNDMFNPQESDKAMLEELLELRNMLRQYGDLSGLHDMIMKPEEEIHENIKTLLKQKEFEKASALLAVQNCVQDTRISKGLQKLAYVKYAFNLVRINKMEEASQRLQQAFAVDCSDNSELEYDIFFLYDEETDTKIDGEPTPASFLSKTVGEFSVCESGLRFTRNSHQVKPGRWRAQEQTKLMQSSMHIVLILDENEEPKGELQYFINIAKEIHNVIKSKLSLILVDDSPCPLDLKPFPHMHFERKLIQCPDSYILWVRKFFFNLLDVSDSEDNVCDSLDTCLRVY